jgi:hypothetical protein
MPFLWEVVVESRNSNGCPSISVEKFPLAFNASSTASSILFSTARDLYLLSNIKLGFCHVLLSGNLMNTGRCGGQRIRMHRLTGKVSKQSCSIYPRHAPTQFTTKLYEQLECQTMTDKIYAKTVAEICQLHTLTLSPRVMPGGGLLRGL